MTTKQARIANICPQNCQDSYVMAAIPPMGTVANAWSRCHRCLTYWETSPAGELVELVIVLRVRICPKCQKTLPGPDDKDQTHTCYGGKG